MHKCTRAIVTVQNTHIGGCKIVYKCTSAIVTVHICTVTITLPFNILLFFPLSTSLSLFLSGLTLTSCSLPPLISAALAFADCRWFWLFDQCFCHCQSPMVLISGFDDFDEWVLMILIRGYWSGWWWLGFWWVGWWWKLVVVWVDDGGLGIDC